MWLLDPLNGYGTNGVVKEDIGWRSCQPEEKKKRYFSLNPLAWTEVHCVGLKKKKKKTKKKTKERKTEIK